MPKKNNAVATEQLPRFTIQMVDSLYTVIHQKAVGRGHKVYEFFNLLIMLGIKEWSKTQPAKDKINVNSPMLAQARKLASVIK